MFSYEVPPRLAKQLPLVYIGFYAEQVSMSVKSAGPIAWSWK